MSDSSGGRQYVEKLLRRKNFRAAIGGAKENLLRFAGTELPEIRLAIELQRKRLADAGFPADGDWVECLDHIARIAERDPKGLTADEIERWALAWIDRESIRRKMADRLSKPEWKGPSLVPLTESQQEAYDYIRDFGPKIGKEICAALGIESESTFTRHYVPALKMHGVRNRRGLGYYLPAST